MFNAQLPMGEPTDEVELVAALRCRDLSAFEALIQPLIQPAYRVAFSVLGDRQQAEDAVQEAAIRAWRHAPRLREDTRTLRPWFLTVVVNQCRSMRRARWWSVIKQSDPMPGHGVESGEDKWVERLDLVRAVRKLRSSERAILYLRFGLDLPLEEVAAVLRISPAAAKTRVYRAVARLRPELAHTADQMG